MDFKALTYEERKLFSYSFLPSSSHLHVCLHVQYASVTPQYKYTIKYLNWSLNIPKKRLIGL